MNTAQVTSGQSSAKFKTTLYLTEDNKNKLDLLNAKNRTRLINLAISEKLAAIERELLKEKLLSSLDNVEAQASGGVSTEDALHEIRERELKSLVVNDE